MKRASIVFGLLTVSACSTVPSMPGLPSMPTLGGEPMAVFPVAPDAPGRMGGKWGGR